MWYGLIKVCKISLFLLQLFIEANSLNAQMRLLQKIHRVFYCITNSLTNIKSLANQQSSWTYFENLKNATEILHLEGIKVDVFKGKQIFYASNAYFFCVVEAHSCI